jgi:AhpD family alkylhydroperoxidase
MMLDWNGYQKQLGETIAEIGKTSPDIVRGYRTLSDAGAKTNHLDAKTRELIAIAVGVTRQCDGCIVTHSDLALKHGATKEEIVEALGVAISVNAGAALVYASRVLDAVAAKTAP